MKTEIENTIETRAAELFYECYNNAHYMLKAIPRNRKIIEAPRYLIAAMARYYDPSRKENDPLPDLFKGIKLQCGKNNSVVMFEIDYVMDLDDRMLSVALF